MPPEIRTRRRVWCRLWHGRPMLSSLTGRWRCWVCADEWPTAADGTLRPEQDPGRAQAAFWARVDARERERGRLLPFRGMR